MRKGIYLDKWLAFKPYDKQALTDVYYLRICNKIKKTLSFMRLSEILDETEIDNLSCFLTSYFEDLISNTGIWNAFVRIHKRLYGKQLPFFNLDEYYEEEINPQDINFLIWYFINTLKEDTFIPPFNYLFAEMSIRVFDILDEEWEVAPENEYLQSFYYIDENEEDYYIARKLIDTVLYGTYLFFNDTRRTLRETEFNILNKNQNHNDRLMQLNSSRDFITINSYTSLLGIKGKDWVAEILGENHLLSKEYKEIPRKIEGFFLYKGQDDNNIFLEHIASGKKFNLTKKSFDEPHDFSSVDEILWIGIVRWKREWWFSGIFFEQEFDADVILDEKKSITNKMSVDFLDYEKPEVMENINLQMTAFKEYNNGSLIAFLPSKEIEDFYHKFIEFYNRIQFETQKKSKDAKQKPRVENNFQKMNLSEIASTGLVFFNPKGGIEIAMGINSAFPMPQNLYFNEEDSDDHIKSLLLNPDFSKELTMFCIDNCKNDLTFFNDDVGKFILEDIDFLLRFFKKGGYYKNPSITLVGQSENS